MKVTQKIFYIIVGVIFGLLFVVWGNGSLNNYLPFFLTTDGWNKYEREMNKQLPIDPVIVSTTYHSGQDSLSVDYDKLLDTVTFTHPKTGTVTLPQVMGARYQGEVFVYANADETVEFWENRGEVSLFVADFQVFKGTIDTRILSREAYEGCVWEKVVGAGLELWGQSCDYGDKKIRVGVSESLPGVFLEDVTGDYPVATGLLIQVFQLPNQQIEDVLSELQKIEGWEVSDYCAFTKIENDRTGVTRYNLMPAGDALKKFQRDGENEPINNTCAGYGLGNSGVQYFEIHASNPSKALFINVGQEPPLFDEKTIVVK